jgi:hypothetical protein
MDFFDNGRRIAMPGFARQDGVVARQIVFPPAGMSGAEWYQDFKARFERALDHHEWLPIYRASHGEFVFVSGRREAPALGKGLARYCVSRVYRVLQFQSTFYSGTPGYGYETYKQWHLPRLRRELRRQVGMVAREGIVCCYFSDRDTIPIGEQREFSQWVASAGTPLGRDNYGHIYFVYGLFHGENWEKYFSGRKLLFISSDQPDRTAALNKTLRRLEVREWRFIPISRSHSMLDRIKLPADFEPDLCIVGAGVGAANILEQLRGLSCPCVDAGFVMDTLAFPSFKARRIYCVNDLEWDGYFGAKPPAWAEKFSDAHSFLPEVREGRFQE